MWKEERKRKKTVNIILAVLCIVIAVGLLYGIKIVREQTAQEQLLLSEEYLKQQAAQTTARESTVGDIENEYQRDLDTVAEYLPGIVCWGDTLTSGSSGTVSFPYILQKYIDTYICDIYDFHASIENADEFSRLDWDKYKVRIPVVNMGVENEESTTVLGRSGVMPIVLKEDTLIPAGTDTIEISITGVNDKHVSPLCGGDGGVNPVTINGITGTLSVDTDEIQYWGNPNVRYYFKRLESGSECLVQAGTPIITSAADKYRDYIHVVCVGTYGEYESSSDLVAQIKALLARQTHNSDRYLVLGICYQNGWRDMSALDTVMLQAFGEHYINIRKYLCSDGLAEAGLTPTDDEKMEAAAGIVPARLRSSSGDAGLSARAYKLIGELVYDRMEKLGYFDEVVNELYIEEVRKELLKENPNYFVNIIKSW